MRYAVRMHISEEQYNVLNQHLELVCVYNEQVNLTTVTGDQAYVIHIEDSLKGIDVVGDAPEGPLVDLGSGAGFPAIPLAVATQRPVTLVESVGKKARALEQMCMQLQLENTKVYAGRAEELALENPEAYAVVTARALTQLPSLIELASPLLFQGGWLVAYKADDIDDELTQARAIENKLGMSYKESHSVTLSDGTPRTLIVFEKVGEPRVHLPRRPGMAQKRPYTS